MRVPACSHIRMGGVCSASPHNQPQLAWHRTCTVTSSYTNSQEWIQWGFRARREEDHVLSCHTYWYQSWDRASATPVFCKLLAVAVADVWGLQPWLSGQLKAGDRAKEMRTASKKQLSISGSLGWRTLVYTYSLTKKTIVSLFPMLFTYSVGDPSSPQISLQCIQSPAPAQAVIFQSEFKWTCKHAESEWHSMWCCCLNRNIVHPTRLFDVYLWFSFSLVTVVKT